MKKLHSILSFIGSIALSCVTGSLHPTALSAQILFPSSEYTAGDVPAFGAQGAFQANIPLVNFKELSDCPNCNTAYTKGFGTSVNIGGLYQFPIATPLPGASLFQVRATYSALSSVLTGTQFYSASSDNSTKLLEIEHRLQNSLQHVGFEPSFIYYPLENKGLQARIGMQVGYIFSATYDQKEVLISPTGALFENNKTTRNEQSGTISQVNNLQFGSTIGIGYELPISSNLLVVPELSYTYNFSTVVSNISWNANTLKLGVSAVFPILPAPEPPAEPERYEIQRSPLMQVPELKPPPPFLSVAVEATGLFRDDSTDQIQRKKPFSITIDETEFRETLPLLPVVYFPESSSSLESSHILRISPSQTTDFSESYLPTNAVEFYKYTLNIIGKRLRENPDASITITAINSAEGSQKSIENERVIAVKDYFVSTWGIDEKRIKVAAKPNPKRINSENPNKQDIADVLEESRRVEISSASYEVMKPVLILRNIKNITPEQIEISPKIESEAGISSSSMQITHGVKQVFSSAVGNATNTLDLRPELFQLTEDSLKISLVTRDIARQEKSTSIAIPVVQSTVDKKRKASQADVRIEKFSLILFNFDIFDLDSKNKRIIDEVKSRIQPNSIVKIFGYSDRVGTAEYNKNLAENRCKEVYKYLKSSVQAGSISYQAVGAENLLYDNNLPEGRSYSRTVQIIIETPVNHE